MRSLIVVFVITCLSVSLVHANNDTLARRYWSLETDLYFGHIVENASNVPKSTNPYLFEFNPSVQTNGNKEWHHIFGFPKVGCSVILGDLGNHRELGNIIGLMPNITFSITKHHWYSPRICFGLGLAYFNRPYDVQNDSNNVYIGSHITALAHASLYIQPKITKHFSLKAGIAVFHCSNCHYQVPNLGINFPAVFIGFIYHPLALPSRFERRRIQVPDSKLKFNIRVGLGVHELAGTFGPIGTPKYAIYITDLYLSRRYGRASNVQAGFEIKHYNSYYNDIIANERFTEDQKLKATVISVCLGHELMIHRFSLLTQGGINIYNPYYNKYQYKKQKGLREEFKKYICTRVGVQYYLFDPKYCTSSNIFIGTYIKANFGQADCACIQLGVVF